MHKLEELQAILALFDGEIRISEKETEKGSEKTLTIRRMYNQKYIEKDLPLKRDRMQE
jgi:hypothetical protein